MNNDILKDAIAEAKRVKSVAIENAKEVLIESFTPRIQSMLSSKIQEEDGEEPIEFGAEDGEEEEEEFEEPMEEANVLDGQQEKDDKDVTPNFKEGEEPIDEEEEFEEEPDEEYFEESDGEEEFEEEPIEEPVEDEEDLEIEAILDELDAEDEDEEALEEPVFDDEIEEANVLDGQQKKDDKAVTQNFKGKTVKEGEFEDNPDVTNSTPDEEDRLEEDEEINLEELLTSLDEAGWPGEENSEYKDKEEQNVVKTLENVRKVNNRLKKQLSEYKKTVNYLRQELKEINLLNTKLLHTTKIFKNFNVNTKARKHIIETFDRAKSEREVKLIYATLYESYKSGRTSAPKKKATSLTEVVEGTKGASGQVKSTKVPDKVVLVEGNDFVSRMKKLANIK